MAKTRSQTVTSQITEKEGASNRLLNKVKNTAKETSNIAKRKVSKGNNHCLSPVRQVKQEEGTDAKCLLKPLPARRKKALVTEEQAKQFIDNVINKNMSIKAASRKVNIDHTTGSLYYYRYKKDPKKSPLLNTRPKSRYTYEEVKALIGYIVDDGMSLREASRAANMTFSGAQLYYKRYTEDPNHDIPLPVSHSYKRNNACSQDQITRLIHYIVNDNMSIQMASIKVNVGEQTAKRYYGRYLRDPDHKIPVPNKTGSSRRIITQGQIESLIGYIVNDKLSIEDASIKADMSERSGGRYYHLYLNDPDRQIPVPRKRVRGFYPSCSQEKVTELIRYVVDDSMPLIAASVKAKMSVCTAKKYYDKYMDDPNHAIPVTNKGIRNNRRFTHKQITELIDYIVDDKMSITAASRKVKMSAESARKYYNRYLNDPNHRIPGEKGKFGKRCTKHQIEKLISYIVDDKMSLCSASMKADMSEPTARKYYKQYLNDVVSIKKENKGS